MESSTANRLPPDVQFEKQLGQLATFVRVMRQAGLPIEKALQMPIDDKEMRARLVRFWTCGGYEATTSQRRAREIMGKNFFGVEEAAKHFGVNPTRQQLGALAEIPFSEAVLQECKDTHVLAAVFPLSILEIRGKMTAKLFYDQSWYNNEAFAKDRGDVSWQFVRKTPVSNSTSKTWEEQQALLAKDEETPTARVMVYTIIGYFLATGERLFQGVYVRCLDIVSVGSRVYLGHFVSLGLLVSSCTVGYRHVRLGLSASRKFRS